LITGDKFYLEPYTAALGSLAAELAAERALIADNPAQQKNQRNLEQLATARLGQLQLVLNLQESRGLAGAEDEILQGQGRHTDQAIREEVLEMEAHENKLLLEREQRADRTSLITRSVIVLGGLLAFSFVSVAPFLITRDIAGSRVANAALQDAKENLEQRVTERTADLVSANAQLRLSREQFAVTLTSIGDGVFTTDAERLTGWTREQAERQPLVSIFPIFNEETREPVSDPAKKVLELGITVGLANHTVLISRNGKETPIADSGAPIRDAEGKMLGVVLVFRDCTMEREKESALRERVALREQLAQVADSVLGAIFSFVLRSDGSCCFPYSNAAIEEVYGISPEQLAVDGASIFNLIHPDDLPGVRQYIEECATRLTTWSGEYRVNHARKGEIWVEGRAVPQRLADGSILWNGFLQDSSDRRHIEQQVRGGEARLSAIIHSALSGVITVDESQNIILFNPAAERMFGCTEAEALGRPLDQLIPERYRGGHKKHIRKFGETEIDGRMMGQREGIYGVRRNGDEFPVEASISHVEFGGKRVYTVILRDITEEKKAEEALKQQASLLDLAPVLVRDLENRIVFWSRGAEKLYGFTKEEAFGRNSHELLSTEGPLPMAYLDQLLHTNGVWEGELLQHGQGRRRGLCGQPVGNLSRCSGAPSEHPGGECGHHRAAARGRTANAFAKAGSVGHAGRRDRARFQQHSAGDPREREPGDGGLARGTPGTAKPGRDPESGNARQRTGETHPGI
jgi:PAS domain S-box-containing protein